MDVGSRMPIKIGAAIEVTGNVNARKMANNIQRILFGLDSVLPFLINNSTRHNKIIALELKLFKPIIYSLIIWWSCSVFKLLNSMIWKVVRIKACSQNKTVLAVKFLMSLKVLLFWSIDLFFALEWAVCIHWESNYVPGKKWHAGVVLDPRHLQNKSSF